MVYQYFLINIISLEKKVLNNLTTANKKRITCIFFQLLVKIAATYNCFIEYRILQFQIELV